MKRLSLVLSALASLAFASGAAAYPTSNPVSTVDANANVGGNGFFFNAIGPATPDPNSLPTGELTIVGVDANLGHAIHGTLTCMTVDPYGVLAGMLFSVDGVTSAPSVIHGVLVHVLDPDASSSENGLADRVDFRNLNQKQYDRQLAAGCPPAFPRAQIDAGNITVTRGTL